MAYRFSLTTSTPSQSCLVLARKITSWDAPLTWKLSDGSLHSARGCAKGASRNTAQVDEALLVQAPRRNTLVPRKLIEKGARGHISQAVGGGYGPSQSPLSLGQIGSDGDWEKNDETTSQAQAIDVGGGGSGKPPPPPPHHGPSGSNGDGEGFSQVILKWVILLVIVPALLSCIGLLGIGIGIGIGIARGLYAVGKGLSDIGEATKELPKAGKELTSDLCKSLSDIADSFSGASKELPKAGKVLGADFSEKMFNKDKTQGLAGAASALGADAVDKAARTSIIVAIILAIGPAAGNAFFSWWMKKPRSPPPKPLWLVVSQRPPSQQRQPLSPQSQSPSLHQSHQLSQPLQQPEAQSSSFQSGYPFESARAPASPPRDFGN
ncbi:hypothetical protein Vafri_14052 [Volvox africanus]|uniref:Uncharacterized protein n=1 Tax=Volvox africanus TaxID=51714 RepID=A0A8J4F679_9CHLO|nr:hypothetical protein Vafri_14052 [Volvox africanus]